MSRQFTLYCGFQHTISLAFDIQYRNSIEGRQLGHARPPSARRCPQSVLGDEACFSQLRPY